MPIRGPTALQCGVLQLIGLYVVARASTRLRQRTLVFLRRHDRTHFIFRPSKTPDLKLKTVYSNTPPLLLSFCLTPLNQILNSIVAAMPVKSLSKVTKHIKEKKKGKFNALHEHSRDTKRIQRASAREDKLATKISAREKANLPHRKTSLRSTD